VYFIKRKRDREAVWKVIWNGLGLKSADATSLVCFSVTEEMENLDEVLSSVGK
jgi:hypothetical protein